MNALLTRMNANEVDAYCLMEVTGNYIKEVKARLNLYKSLQKTKGVTPPSCLSWFTNFIALDRDQAVEYMKCYFLRVQKGIKPEVANDMSEFAIDRLDSYPNESFKFLKNVKAYDNEGYEEEQYRLESCMMHIYNSDEFWLEGYLKNSDQTIETDPIMLVDLIGKSRD